MWFQDYSLNWRMSYTKNQLNVRSTVFLYSLLTYTGLLFHVFVNLLPENEPLVRNKSIQQSIELQRASIHILPTALTDDLCHLRNKLYINVFL